MDLVLSSSRSTGKSTLAGLFKLLYTLCEHTPTVVVYLNYDSGWILMMASHYWTPVEETWVEIDSDRCNEFINRIVDNTESSPTLACGDGDGFGLRIHPQDNTRWRRWAARGDTRSNMRFHHQNSIEWNPWVLPAGIETQHYLGSGRVARWENESERVVVDIEFDPRVWVYGGGKGFPVT
jgi:hypothetical protein